MRVALTPGTSLMFTLDILPSGLSAHVRPSPILTWLVRIQYGGLFLSTRAKTLHNGVSPRFDKKIKAVATTGDSFTPYSSHRIFCFRQLSEFLFKMRVFCVGISLKVFAQSHNAKFLPFSCGIFWDATLSYPLHNTLRPPWTACGCPMVVVIVPCLLRVDLGYMPRTSQDLFTHMRAVREHDKYVAHVTYDDL
jgi:hypothetical protein